MFTKSSLTEPKLQIHIIRRPIKAAVVELAPCLPLQQPCASRNQFVFWDSYHPTQAANAIIAYRSYSQYATDCIPISIHPLAQLDSARSHCSFSTKKPFPLSLSLSCGLFLCVPVF
uniref:Triacylglycerol lipase n=1 Tax=Opuntia streptacantha TaxID=393608 RepID=A0A7C9ES88_OPUST